MGATDILEKKYLTHLMRGETLPSFTPVLALGLASAAANFTEAGSAFVPGNDEMTGGAYARVDLTEAGGVFSPSDIASYTGASPLTNALQIAFPVASSNWPAIRFWMILDNSTDELLAFGQLAADITVASGQQVLFDVGQFAVTID